MNRRWQAGEGRIGFFFWLAVFAAALLVAYRAIPVKIQDAQLVDYTVELAQFRNNQTTERLEADVLQRAKELQIPIDKKNISVEKYKDRIRFKFSYTVPLEFPGYTYNWTFDHEVERPLFVI